MKRLTLNEAFAAVSECMKKGSPVDVHSYPCPGKVPDWCSVPSGSACAYKCYVCASANLYFWNIDVYSCNQVTTYSIPSEFLPDFDKK